MATPTPQLRKIALDALANARSLEEIRCFDRWALSASVSDGDLLECAERQGQDVNPLELSATADKIYIDNFEYTFLKSGFKHEVVEPLKRFQGIYFDDSNEDLSKVTI